jgi:glycosyltransferase involved in cell wall biosynthesis
VVTVVYNGGKTLEDTINSVINQTYDNVEYILIDGGSKDGTLDIIKKYEDKIAYWVSESDKGIYDAMNKGIRLASGDWIHLLNADDYYFNINVLQKAAEYLKDEKKSFYYFTMMQNFFGKIKEYKYHYHYCRLFYSAYLPHPTLFVSSFQYKSLGLYKTNLIIAADHDFILRLCKKFKANFIDLPLVVMNLSGISSVNMEIGFREFRDVTAENGLNSHLANLIYKIKLFKYRFIVKNRLLRYKSN